MHKNRLLALLCLLITFSNLSYAVNVNLIQKEVRKNHANWISKETSMTKLQENEIKNMLGSLDEPQGHELFFSRSNSNESLDWRNKDGNNWLGPILNQGNCGSCVAFATVAALEARYRISAGQIWVNPTFSPQQLFSCGGGACSFGWRPAQAASFLKKTGIVDSACSPYVSGSTSEDVLCHDIKCADKEKRVYKISDYSTPSGWGGSAEKVKAALKKGPLVTTMTVYEDFLTYGGGIYKHVTGGREGGHAVSIVGFNDLEKYWIVRNSWGSDWGENGFVRVAYDDKSGIGESTWAFDINSDNDYFTIITPDEHQYLSGMNEIKIAMKSPTETKIHLSGELENYVMSGCSVKNNICIQNIDTTLLRDGRYEVYAEANDKRSQVKEFYIVNHKPESNISFSRSDKKPFSTPFVGRIEFDIDIKSRPVIPQILSLIIKDSDGKIVAQRTTDTVLEHMKLGFRFNTLPNGNYKIYYITKTPFDGALVEDTSNVETITTQN